MYQFPYTDFHDLDLDWVIRTAQEAKTDATKATSMLADLEPPDGSLWKQLVSESAAETQEGLSTLIEQTEDARDEAKDAAEDAQEVVSKLASYVASQYDSTLDYAPGSYVMYNSNIYCLPIGSAAGTAFTDTVHTTPRTLGNELVNRINRINNVLINPGWLSGGINSATGAVAANNARAYSNKMRFIDIAEVTCQANIRYQLFFYTSNNTYVDTRSINSGWHQGGYYTYQMLNTIKEAFPSAEYALVSWMFADNSTIDSTALANSDNNIMIRACVNYQAIADIKSDIDTKYTALSTALGQRLYSKRFADLGYVVNGVVDLNDVVEDGLYIIDHSAYTVLNEPANFVPRMLMVLNYASGANHGTRFTYQEALTIGTAETYRRMSQSNGTFNNWVAVNPVNNTYNTVNNEYTSNVTQVSYGDITVTPTIDQSTDYYLASSGDTTDRTADILALLNAYGVCKLGTGDFYVSELTMPDSSSLIGSGHATRLILPAATTTGSVINLNSYNLVSNLAIAGQTSQYNVNTQTPEDEFVIGTRNGISFTDVAVPEQVAGTKLRNAINNVWISDFTGSAIYCNRTGGGPSAIILADNVFIAHCDVGINVAFYSEYHRFTNVNVTQSYYGVICNGGNCVFTNCNFSLCNFGLLMDNSQDQSYNNSHGAFVGCTFNHCTPSNTGTAMKLLGQSMTETFTGCLVFFGDLYIDNCTGIRFSNCSFGKSVGYTYTNNTLLTFTDCTMYNSSNYSGTATGNTALVYTNCYYRNGNSVD